MTELAQVKLDEICLHKTFKGALFLYLWGENVEYQYVTILQTH
jgi:hypothetical protein